MIQTRLKQHAQQCLDAEFECFQRSQADIEASTSKGVLKSDSLSSSIIEKDFDFLVFVFPLVLHPQRECN